MGKLLSANFARLWKDKSFWLCTLFMLGLAIYTVLSAAFSDHPRTIEHFEILYFGYSQLLGFCCAVFASFFLGTDYNEGTIRNKIVVGHSRAAIYVANLLTVFAAMLCMMVAWLLGGLAGLPFFGVWKNIAGCMVNLITSIFTTAAFAAIFTLVAMLCTNKTVSAVTSILLFACLSMLAGNISTEAVRDLLPTGRAIWVTGINAGSSIRTLFASVLLTLFGSLSITIMVTSTGILLFKKKDLK